MQSLKTGREKPRQRGEKKTRGQRAEREIRGREREERGREMGRGTRGIRDVWQGETQERETI